MTTAYAKSIPTAHSGEMDSPSDTGLDLPKTTAALVTGAAMLALAGCGGGNSEEGQAPAESAGTSPQSYKSTPDTRVPTANDEDLGTEGADARMTSLPTQLTRNQASRFLSMAAFGGDAAAIERVQRLGVPAWIEAEFNKPIRRTYLQLMSEGGPDSGVGNDDGRASVEYAMWRNMITSPAVLRQRITLALTEIFVLSIIPVIMVKRGFAVGKFMDVLEANAFGNYRDLLMQVSTTSAMGSYLSFRGNKKADPITGYSPDENYAREIMQLFSIGPVKLNLDGTPVLKANGDPDESYTGADVGGLARVFTGWFPAHQNAATDPMVQIRQWHELGPKTFLGQTIAENTDGVASLEKAIDVLMNHPNMAPFIGRQLIQRLVTSNPGKAYVAHVANAFNGDGVRPKGDMKATIMAVLTWPRNFSDDSLINPRRGKLREPMVRFLQWARTFNLRPSDTTGRFEIGNLSNESSELGQSPLRAKSVFNFFRPGYIPPNTSQLGKLKLTAPEVSITTEVSVAGYLNFMQGVVSQGIGGMKGDYSALRPYVRDSLALLNELNTLMAAGQIGADTLAPLAAALDTIDVSTPTGMENRLSAAVYFVMAAPDYVAQK